MCVDREINAVFFTLQIFAKGGYSIFVNNFLQLLLLNLYIIRYNQLKKLVKTRTKMLTLDL